MGSLSPSSLLTEAAAIYDAHGESAEGARQLSLSGFSGGAQWMAREMARHRRSTLTCPVSSFTTLGAKKYGLAILGATAFGLPAIVLSHSYLLPLAVFGFYLVESRFVFAFPLAIDGCSKPLLKSHRLVSRHHSFLGATFSTMSLGAVMIFGGFLGQGWLRSWCLGCLGVVIWYEGLREMDPQ